MLKVIENVIKYEWVYYKKCDEWIATDMVALVKALELWWIKDVTQKADVGITCSRPCCWNKRKQDTAECEHCYVIIHKNWFSWTENCVKCWKKNPSPDSTQFVDVDLFRKPDTFKLNPNRTIA